MGGNGRALIVHPTSLSTPGEPVVLEAANGDRASPERPRSAPLRPGDRRRGRRLPDRLLRGLLVDRLA